MVIDRQVDRNQDDVTDLHISLSNVHLTLNSRAGPVNILRGIDLAVPAGETLAIVGPSGSGKTSLLMIIAGLERATSGRVVVHGEEITSINEDDLAALRGRDIGIVFQSFHLVPTMTALENVALSMELAGESNAFERAGELLKDVGLGSRVDHFPAQLSGGEQQRVALARAISRRPPLILADEPTGNLDGSTGQQIIELLFGLAEKLGVTLVLVTHDEALAGRADRVVRMADGRIVRDDLQADREKAVVR